MVAVYSARLAEALFAALAVDVSTLGAGVRVESGIPDGPADGVDVSTVAGGVDGVEVKFV